LPFQELKSVSRALGETSHLAAITGHSSKWPQILEYSAFRLVNL
jgi:hypothetical protein